MLVLRSVTTKLQPQDVSSRTCITSTQQVEAEGRTWLETGSLHLGKEQRLPTRLIAHRYPHLSLPTTSMLVRSCRMYQFGQLWFDSNTLHLGVYQLWAPAMSIPGPKIAHLSTTHGFETTISLVMSFKNSCNRLQTHTKPFQLSPGYVNKEFSNSCQGTAIENINHAITRD